MSSLCLIANFSGEKIPRISIYFHRHRPWTAILRQDLQTIPGHPVGKQQDLRRDYIEERGKIKKLTFMNTIPMYQI